MEPAGRREVATGVCTGITFRYRRAPLPMSMRLLYSVHEKEGAAGACPALSHLQDSHTFPSLLPSSTPRRSISAKEKSKTYELHLASKDTSSMPRTSPNRHVEAEAQDLVPPGLAPVCRLALLSDSDCDARLETWQRSHIVAPSPSP